MIDTVDHALPHGITLHCRVSGDAGRPVLMFLHGFPEGAFIWDGLLAHFSRPEHGGWRCVAPNLRGFGPSSSPADAQAYRAKHLKDFDAQLLQDATARTLPAVSFSKPQGHLNRRPGYANAAEGDAYIANVIAQLPASPQWKNMLIVVT